MVERLKNIFLELMARYSGNELFNLECWQEIEHQYSNKGRYYHSLKHLSDMIDLLPFADSPIVNFDALLFTIFYHDVVYKVTKKDNEFQSARLFEKRISKTSFPAVEQSKRQIISTKAHLLADDYDTNLLLDIDLSVLGKSADIYDAYAINIRKEYAVYPSLLYKRGRKSVLESFLKSSQIYKTAYFVAHFEEQARINLKRELEFL